MVPCKALLIYYYMEFFYYIKGDDFIKNIDELRKDEEVRVMNLLKLSLLELCLLYRYKKDIRFYIREAISIKVLENDYELIESKIFIQIVSEFTEEQLWKFVANNKNNKSCAIVLAQKKLFQIIDGTMPVKVKCKVKIKKIERGKLNDRY